MPMNPGMKMMMIERSRGNNRNARSEYGGTNERRMIGYDRDYETENRRRYAEGNRMAYYDMEEPESRRRRDSRGRYAEGDGWEDNRGYAESRYEPESRRRRDSRGRYMMGDMDYGDDAAEMRSAQTWYPPHGAMPYVPPMNYAPSMAAPSMALPSTAVSPMAVPTAPVPPAGMPAANMYGDMNAPVDEQTARMWVMKMDNGEHFKLEHADQLRASICPDCKRFEFYVAINAMYSDHCETAKKINMDKPEYYAMLAKDFLKDSDAKPHKLRRYMETIAK